VAVLEALAIVLALVVLAMLPCLLVFLVFVDAFMRTVHRQRQRIRREAAEAELVASQAPEPEVIGPPLERIAAEIHRLARARRICESGTPRFVAATKAYDRRLIYACRALELNEHMDGLSGVDLDLERLRVEGLLLEAGFVLDTDSTRPL
jgi:hypothetical protein